MQSGFLHRQKNQEKNQLNFPETFFYSRLLLANLNIQTIYDVASGKAKKDKKIIQIPRFTRKYKLGQDKK